METVLEKGDRAADELEATPEELCRGDTLEGLPRLIGERYTNPSCELMAAPQEIEGGRPR